MIYSMMNASRSILFTMLVIAFVLETLTGWRWLQAVEGTLALLSLIVSLHAARRMFQIVAALFITAGIACIVWANVPLTEVPFLMTSNVMLISLLYMLPFVNRVIRIGGYDRHLSRWLNVQSGHLGHLYVRSLAVSYLLSLFLFFAAIPLLHRVLSKHLQGQDLRLTNRLMSMSILRGFGIVSVWSPVEPLVATAVLITGVSYLSLLPWMLGLSAILFIAGGLWGLQFRKIPLKQETGVTPLAPSWSKTGAFLLALVLLIASAFALQAVLGISFFAAMTFALLPFSLLWSVILRRFKRFVSTSRKQWKNSVDGLRHLLVLFLSFGFFNGAVSKTHLFQLMEEPVQAMSQWPVVLFVFIFLVCLILPIIGVHPLVVMSLFGIFLQPILQVMNPLSIAIVLVTSCLCSSFMGTFNTTVTIMSGLLQVNPYRITLWNFVFGLVYGVIGVIAALCLL
ncbi:hypothetical protein [Paenibacillus radicis (ex Xue et al. 2023)]|uniref:Uncharacterized protein n=1 Tax=Paenibacillus radicis (ex Xue et al. 2023) TaxID=2972489 RepID=A0ABT1YR00_9BACL|nr:hypothetical protein [Paenibacillus radicis (ex Xue et al. 2023)]MCR8635614.1 hypothetical protein [Paenibacillus radicis (ex Xue et al. 2023)]